MSSIKRDVKKKVLELLDRLNPTIAELSQAVEREAEKCPEAQRLMIHPGVGALSALAFVLIIGETERFQGGKQIADYLGLVPLEKSIGKRRRLGHITKQGSSIVRFLLVEAAQVTVRSLPEWRSKYVHLMMRRFSPTTKCRLEERPTEQPGTGHISSIGARLCVHALLPPPLATVETIFACSHSLGEAPLLVLPYYHKI